MNKLNKEEFYKKLKRVADMVDEKHKDYEVQLLLADLYYTICEFFIWEWPKIIYRAWKIKEAIEKHKNCCDLDE